MASQQQEIAGVRILVVEDEYLLATELAAMLRSLGAEVLGPVPSVARARALLDSAGYPDVALLDVNLGGTFVWPIADLMQAAGVPSILATGYDETVIGPPYDRLPRCEKPINLDGIVALVTQAIAARGPPQA